MTSDLTAGRKADHLAICATQDVGFRTGTLLDQVGLHHNALPEVAWDEIDTSTVVLGKRLSAPIIISSMTGGTAEAAAFNRVLARVAERLGIGLALGSQRIMLEDPEARDGFLLRPLAPTTLLLGNLGAVQARELSPETVEERLVTACGLDGLYLHLNVAQELFQPEGDRDFSGVEAAIGRMARSLRVPVVVKETGSGLSRDVGTRLRRQGVSWVEVAGAGGTSFVAVEAARGNAVDDAVSTLFRDWGIPTAASLCQLSGLGLHTIGSGGITTGLDIARALVLGASAAGVARPVLVAYRRDGEAGVTAYLERLIHGLKVAMMLTGSESVAALHALSWRCGPSLAPWLVPETPVASRAMGTRCSPIVASNLHRSTKRTLRQGVGDRRFRRIT